MGEACSTHERNAYNILVGKTERSRTLGRPRRWWEGNINIHLKEM
jgi:hypothetical protein